MLHTEIQATTADTRAEQIDRLITALPDAIHQSMKTTLGEGYTPERAAQFAETMAACLRQDHTSSDTRCPDGITWCLGNPAHHADPREHRHEGPEYGLNGSYVDGNPTESIAAFQIVQWDDREPHLVFQSDGTWPDLCLTQVDELIGDAVLWLVQLIATRRRIAIEVSPQQSTVPFTESQDKQTASAAFDLATKAVDVALAKTADRAGTLRALRNFLDLAEAEQA